MISFREIAAVASRLLACGIVAGAVVFGMRVLCGGSLLLRLDLQFGVFGATFLVVLVFAAGQKLLYLVSQAD